MKLPRSPLKDKLSHPQRNSGLLTISGRSLPSVTVSYNGIRLEAKRSSKEEVRRPAQRIFTWCGRQIGLGRHISRRATTEEVKSSASTTIFFRKNSYGWEDCDSQGCGRRRVHGPGERRRISNPKGPEIHRLHWSVYSVQICLAQPSDGAVLTPGNLPYTATDESVSKHFAKINPKSIRHRKEKGTEKSKGFAFLEFEGYDRMKTCLKLYHQSDFEDGESPARKLNVELTWVSKRVPKSTTSDT